MSVFSDFTMYDEPIEIFLGDNTVIFAEGEGSVRISTYSSNNSEPNSFRLYNVLYVPKLTKKLVSVASMTRMGAQVYFDKDKCIILKNDKYITIGHILNAKLYLLNTECVNISYSNPM